MKKFLILILTLILTITSLTLTACAPVEEKAKKNLEEAGYTITKYENEYKEFSHEWRYYYSSPTIKTYGLMEAIISANLGEDWVTIYYFDNTDSAKDYVSDYKYYNPNRLKDEAGYPKRDGRVIFMGTEDAINVAKGK